MSLVTFLMKKVGSSEPLDLFCYTMLACVSSNVFLLRYGYQYRYNTSQLANKEN